MKKIWIFLQRPAGIYIVVGVFLLFLTAALIYVYRKTDDAVSAKATYKAVEKALQTISRKSDTLKSEIRYANTVTLNNIWKSVDSVNSLMKETDWKIIKERTKYETYILQADTAGADELLRILTERYKGKPAPARQP